jgi:hypothetical protein
MGPPGHHGGGVAIRGCGGSYADASYRERSSTIDRELHERAAKTQRAKDEFRKTHPCPEAGSTSGACPGFEIACVDPDPGNPARCFDSSNLEWRPIRPSTLQPAGAQGFVSNSAAMNGFAPSDPVMRSQSGP